MTPDDTLRALAALEAAWRQDSRALEALAECGPGETRLPVLVADYGDLVLDSMLSLACGIHGGMDEAEFDAAMERKEADVTVRMCAALGRTLKSWAATAPDSASGDVARAVVDAVHTFTAAGEEDVLRLLAALRAGVLGGS
ncbi:hypothetical protein ACFZB9_34705 [Kitasatospora sp. NPDC008050]|uniref:hypothetical protein n=1 Tax=unclassified Kitasatospora TaxID=2633591 RepID=UPI002E0EEB0B|nr:MULTISPECIES: hypothetical protein [unclassified Kitasatospora]WSJ71018.1 hypothetical protein OG294_35750 [Kitasatospora sp. NBC_01302]